MVCCVSTRAARPFEVLLPICQSVGTKEGVGAAEGSHRQLHCAHFASISDANASSVAVALSEALQALLRPLSFVIAGQKMDCARNELEQERIRHLVPAFFAAWKAAAARLCDALLQFSKAARLLAESQLNAAAGESVLLLLKGFYAAAEQTVKQFAYASDCCPLQALTQLAQSISEKLTPAVYALIQNVQKQSSSEAHVRKQAKLVPDVIFAIEQYEAKLVQVNKKTKGAVNLTMFVRRSTARDFRIDSAKLKNRLNKREENGEEAEELVRAKREHVESSVC